MSNKILLVLAIGLFSINYLVAQKINDKEEKPSNCEQVRYILDSAIVEALDNKDSYLIFIFQSGKKENAKKSNKLRMETIRKHLNLRVPKYESYVIAESGKRYGLGKLSVYVKGKLFGELYSKKNTNFGYDCLDESF